MGGAPLGWRHKNETKIEKNQTNSTDGHGQTDRRTELPWHRPIHAAAYLLSRVMNQKLRKIQQNSKKRYKKGLGG